MPHRCHVATLLFMLLIAQTKPLLAGIIVNLDGNTIVYGQTSVVTVRVSSDSLASSPDIVDSFSALFRIAPVGTAPVNGLQFVDPQGDAQLGNPNYLFAGNSLFAPGPIGTVSSFTHPNDTYAGGDATLDGLGVPLDNSLSPFVLFQLNLSALAGQVGDQYTLQMLSSGSEFLDPAYLPLTIDGNSYLPLTITVITPEPSSFVLCMGVATCGALAYRRRLHKRRLQPTSSNACPEK